MRPGQFVAVAGNIGVGKTNLTTLLANHLGWRAYYEPVIDNPYLDDFYCDMERWSFHLQVFFLSKRFAIHREMVRSEEPWRHCTDRVSCPIGTTRTMELCSTR
jgi:deoxyadenosine/deoxycytidine kinase